MMMLPSSFPIFFPEDDEDENVLSPPPVFVWYRLDGLDAACPSMLMCWNSLEKDS